MLNVKDLSVEGLTAQTTFDLEKQDDTPFGNVLKLSLPKANGESFKYELIVLPCGSGSGGIMQPVVEVAVNHATSQKFCGRYFLSSQSMLQGDPANIEKWNIWKRNGSQTSDAFRGIRISHGNRSKYLMNVFTLSHSNPKEMHKVKLMVYGPKIAEIISEAMKGESDKWDYDAPINPLKNILIVPVKPGMLPSEMYSAARFVPDKKDAIAEVHAKLNNEDLYNIEGIIDGSVDCGQHMNPSKERINDLLERGGYLVNGVAPSTYEVQADNGTGVDLNASVVDTSWLDEDDNTAFAK